MRLACKGGLRRAGEGLGGLLRRLCRRIGILDLGAGSAAVAMDEFSVAGAIAATAGAAGVSCVLATSDAFDVFLAT